MIKTIFRNVTFRIRITGAMVALVTMAITLMGFGVESKEYRQLANERDPGFARYAATHKYADIFLISADGDVVYSLNREAELFNFID